MRLIDVDARIEEIKKVNCTGCNNYNGIRCRACWVDDAIGLFDDAPTVDAVEVVHGRWDRVKFFAHATLHHCSICGHAEIKTYNYCPNCGAKMDGGN